MSSSVKPVHALTTAGKTSEESAEGSFVLLDLDSVTRRGRTWSHFLSFLMCRHVGCGHWIFTLEALALEGGVVLHGTKCPDGTRADFPG